MSDFVQRPKTIICDIDGVLIMHEGNLSTQVRPEEQPKLLAGALKKLNEWDRKGYKIILLTGRKESCRNITEQQLQRLCIFYDQLVMGATGGERVLINDLKQNDDTPTARAICVKRNQGIENIDI